VRFHVSIDDPGSDPGDFERRVHAEARDWLRRGFPVRTRAVLEALGADWERRLGVANGDRVAGHAYGSDPLTVVTDG
jgi:elongation factor P hydroxylase